MRVLLIVNIFPPGFIGGYELAAQDIARMLARSGHTVTVLTSPALSEQAAPTEPFTVLRTLHSAMQMIEYMPPADRVMRRAVMDLGNLRAVAQAVEQARPEALICFNLAGLGVLGLLAFCRALRLPMLVMLMDNWFAERPPDFAALRSWFGLAEPFAGMQVAACSVRVMREVDDILGGPPTPATIIPAWVELAPPAPLPSPAPGAWVKFLFSSRVAPHKGIGIVIEAAALLRARAIMDFTIDIYGAGMVGDTMQAVYAKGLETCIQYRGLASKTEMIRIFDDYDALLFPTWSREPSGFVAAEAACAGCIPIITADMGGAEFLLDEQDCLKIARDPVSLAGAMERLISMPPRERLEFRRRVRRNGRRTFDAEPIYRRFEDLLQTTFRERGDDATPTPTQAATALALDLLTHIWRTTYG